MSAHKQHKLAPVEKLVKVTFELETSDWHDHATETMWAAVVDERTYTIRNVPFYVYGVSYGDVVVAERKGGERLFRRVYQRGGHSTYRIFLVDEKMQKEFEIAWKPLDALGCTYERATDYLVAVDVPADSDIYAAYSALEKGMDAGSWDFEEGHCGHPVQ